MNTSQLIAGIEKLAPWYQRIVFPEHGVTTTDRDEWAVMDTSPDNLFPGMSTRDASVLRPVAKWEYIREFLPPLEGLDVLEIGCNCGFFSFQFAAMGARRVYGADLHITPNARFARKALGLEDRVAFIEGDFLAMRHPDAPLDKPADATALPRVDVVFAASVLTHVGYPFLALHTMLRLAKRWLVVDEIAIGSTQLDDTPGAVLMWNPGDPCHSFGFSLSMYRTYLERVGVPRENISLHLYPTHHPEGRPMRPTKVCLVVDTRYDDSAAPSFHP